MVAHLDVFTDTSAIQRGAWAIACRPKDSDRQTGSEEVQHMIFGTYSLAVHGKAVQVTDMSDTSQHMIYIIE